MKCCFTNSLERSLLYASQKEHSRSRKENRTTPIAKMAAEEDALLDSLLEKEIPHGMQELVESHTNLANLAAYCKENYRQSGDKHAVLQETKRYASQSLASVAYQVHSLAVNMLQMMDQQVIQLKKMEASVAGILLV